MARTVKRATTRPAHGQTHGPRKGPMSSILMGLIGALTALWVHVANDFGPVDSYFPDYSIQAIEQHFSDSYYTARTLFRSRAIEANAELHALPVSVGGLDLTMDVAVIRGSEERLVLHLSGTHGVEGFAGSAIQSAALEDLAKNQSKWSGMEEKAFPTVVFVHAVNPYGFAQLRRFNEHNVDLNRNYLTPEEFQGRLALDPNQNGYMDVYSALNPPNLKGMNGMYWLNAGYHLAQYGFQAIKRATVCGNYHYNQSIFYGGIEKQSSLQTLERFLKAHLKLSKLHQAAIIDVHTGLGPAGYDTLMIEPTILESELHSSFEGTESLKRMMRMGMVDNAVTQGYDAAVGYVASGIVKLLSSTEDQLVAITQEFGTVPGIFVLKALVEENAMFNHGSPAARLPYAERLRDVFYLHRSASWKRSVVERGIALLEDSFRAVVQRNP